MTSRSSTPVEYRGIHKRIDPLKDFRGHERQFLKREIVLAADDEDVVPCAERPCQRRDVRPHDHFPVLPQPDLHELFAVSERGQDGTQLFAQGKHAVRPFAFVPGSADAVVVARGASFDSVPGEAPIPGFFQLQWRRSDCGTLYLLPGICLVKQIHPNRFPAPPFFLSALHRRFRYPPLIGKEFEEHAVFDAPIDDHDLLNALFDGVDAAIQPGSCRRSRCAFRTGPQRPLRGWTG